MQAEFETGHGTEVASTAANRPKQIRMVFRVHIQDLTICGHHLSGEQVVNGQTVFPNQITDTSTKCNSTNSDGACIAKPGGKAMSRSCSRVFDGCQTRLRPGRSCV